MLAVLAGLAVSQAQQLSSENLQLLQSLTPEQRQQALQALQDQTGQQNQQSIQSQSPAMSSQGIVPERQRARTYERERAWLRYGCERIETDPSRAQTDWRSYPPPAQMRGSYGYGPGHGEPGYGPPGTGPGYGPPGTPQGTGYGYGDSSARYYPPAFGSRGTDPRAGVGRTPGGPGVSRGDSRYGVPAEASRYPASTQDQQATSQQQEDQEQESEATDEELTEQERRARQQQFDSTIKQIHRQARIIRHYLQPFGYDLFAGRPMTFSPTADIPVPSDYVIGPGDTVHIQLFGKERGRYELTVNRRGELNLPPLEGPIVVAGLNYNEMRQMLEQRIAEQLIGIRANISMGPLRTIRIFVLGDAHQPGAYTVSSLSTLTHALFVNGGVRPIGSLRNIKLKRQGELVTRFDMYDLLLEGDTSNDVRLQSGDAVLVPPVGPRIGVACEVRRPAFYEFKDSITAGEAANLAGGLLPIANPQATQVERISQQGDRYIIDVDLTTRKGRQFELRDGDVLRAFAASEDFDKVVYLTGHVDWPGSKQWHEGMRLLDVIPQQEVLLPRADLGYVLIKRELPPDRRITVLSSNLQKAFVQPNSPANLRLQPRDEIRVFSIEENRTETIAPLIETLRQQAQLNEPEAIVRILGRVKHPGSYPLEQGMRVSDLVRAGGGLRQDAYAVEGELTRYELVAGKSSAVDSRSINIAAAVRGEQAEDIQLQPFDVLQIKQLPNWRERVTVTVKGEVRYPGQYAVKPGENLSNVIERAGGPTEYAFPAGAIFSRKSLREREKEQIERLRDRLKSDLAAVSLEQLQQGGDNAQQAVATARGLVNALDAIEPTGNIVVDLPRLLAGDESADISLRNGDTLRIPQVPSSVSVIGEVNHASSHLYDATLTREDYIEMSGGLTARADEARVYIVRANGKVITDSGTQWFSTSRNEVRRGDTIVAPLDVDHLRPLTLAKTIAEIMGDFGVAVAAWNTVGVF